MFNFIKKSIIANRAEETILYEYVLDELEDGYKVRGLWAKALAMSEGDENKATSLYMQYRVQNIKDFFVSLKIAYEELSKAQIKNQLINLVKNNEVENNVPKPKPLDYSTKFLEKYDCTEKSINVIVDNKIIRVRNKLNYICFDRFTNEEFIIPVEKFEEISSRENTYIEKTSNGIICSYCETLNSIDNSYCYKCNEPITLNSLIENYKRK